MRTLHKRKQRTTALAFSCSKHWLVVGGRVGPKAGRVDVWDVPSGTKPITLPSLQVPPWGLVFTADGGVAVDLWDRVAVYRGPRFQTMELVSQWDPNHYTRVSFSPDGQRLVLDTEAEIRLLDLHPPFTELWSQPTTGKHVTPGKVAYSPDGQRLAVKAEKSVEIRETSTGTPIALFDQPATGRWFGSKLFWSQDGRWVCEVWQQWLNVWDASTGRPAFQRVASSNEWINDAAFYPLSGRLAIAIASQTAGVVRLYSTDDWREKKVYSWPVGRVETLAFHPDGSLAAVGGDQPEVVLWDVDW